MTGKLEILTPPVPRRGRSFHGDVDRHHQQFGFVATQPWGDFAVVQLFNAADSSILVRLYLDEAGADAIERFLAEDAKAISVSKRARVEVLNVLLRDPDLGAAARFEEDLDEGVRLRTESVDWPDAFQQAESLAWRFSRTLRPGGHDLVLVADFDDGHHDPVERLRGAVRPVGGRMSNRAHARALMFGDSSGTVLGT